MNNAADIMVQHPETSREHAARLPVFTPGKQTLSRRETEVLRLLADGLSTKTVAAQLQVSFKTAACHRYRILQKLGVTSTVSAVRWAIREGIVQP